MGAHYNYQLVDDADPDEIRAYLANGDDSAEHLLLRLLVPPDLSPEMQRRRWLDACALLDSIDESAFRWATAKRRKKIEAFAADPVLLVAMRAAVAHGKNPPLDMLGTLAADGTPESIDALLPHLDPALVSRDDRLDRMKLLGTYARSPRMKAIVAEAKATVSTRSVASPATALGPQLGLGPLKSLQFKVRLASVQRIRASAAYQGEITVDSQEANYLSAWLTQLDRFGKTAFTEAGIEQDVFELGSCAVDELPAWIARASNQLGALELTLLTTNLRGAKRDWLIAWLRGGSV